MDTPAPAPMTKPFDFNDLKARLVAKGLGGAEDLAKVTTTEVLNWIHDSLNLEPNPLYKVAVPLLEVLRPVIMAAEENIDGK